MKPIMPATQAPETRKGLRGLGAVVAASAKAWLRHRAPSKGAALAFYALFSMAPILILAIAIAGRVLDPRSAQSEAFRHLQHLLSPTLAQAVQSLVQGAQAPGSGRTATGVALVLLAVGATSVFAELKDSLDEIWQQQTPMPTGILTVVRTRLLAFLLIVVLACLLLASLAANAFLGLARVLLNGALAYPALLPPAITFLTLVGLFATINKVLPETRISWGDALVGACFTGVLFEAGRNLIGLYLGLTALGSSFGAAGSLAALLVWVYYSAQIFFLGAEFTREYALTFGSLRRPALPQKE